MPEQGELGGGFNKYIEGLRKQAESLRTDAQDHDLEAEYLNKQSQLFEEYGAKVPIAMQTAQFIVEQIAASYVSSSTSLEPPTAGIGSSITMPRPRARYAAPKGGRVGESGNYNIAPLVKPIMNGIFGREKEDVPEDLGRLFDSMYGKDWESRILNVPDGPRRPYITRTYGEDLNVEGSYIRSLIAGADRVINGKMRGNAPPEFPFGGKVAAVELARLYNKIDGIGWGIYDDFMVRNRIRQPKVS